MGDFFSFLKVSVLTVGVVLIAFLALLAWPDSRLRGICLQIAGWIIKGIAALCLIYILSPLDIIPDAVPVAGCFDDLGALFVGVTSAIAGFSSIRAGKNSLIQQSSQNLNLIVSETHEGQDEPAGD